MNTQPSTSKAKRKFLWTAAGSLAAVVLCLFSAKPASAQFDMGVILAMMTSIQQVITSTITPILTTVNSVESNIKQFQQTVMYPMSEINQVKSMATSFGSQMTNMQNQFKNPVNSTTLSATSNLEKQLLGGNPNSVASIASSYSSVYGSLPSSTSVSSDVRTVVDMNDAQAQDGFKTAVKLDAIATTEAQLSQQYMQQLASTAPGNAPLVQAQAAAWNLQASAYTQQALAELLRVQAAETAYQSFLVKHANTQHQQTIKNLGITPSN